MLPLFLFERGECIFLFILAIFDAAVVGTGNWSDPWSNKQWIYINIATMIWSIATVQADVAHVLEKDTGRVHQDIIRLQYFWSNYKKILTTALDYIPNLLTFLVLIDILIGKILHTHTLKEYIFVSNPEATSGLISSKKIDIFLWGFLKGRKTGSPSWEKPQINQSRKRLLIF